jgi:FMN-dependent oxidoreductase (nitrilotriacetate monooxygenase family)
MRLGLFFEGLGHHIAAWRDPKVNAFDRQSFAHFVQIAQTAERGLFDLVFTADTFAMFGPDDPAIWSRTTRMSRHEPLTLLSALAAVTKNIGLVATASTSFYQPMHIARLFASIDQISGGRGGWNLVTSSSETEAASFGVKLPDEKERYRRATEFAAVVKGLWDSWDEDAVIGDKKTGLFMRPDGVHLLNHAGEYYNVRGPLTLPRSPQGRPVIVQAGQSNEGRTLASAVADIVFSVEQNIDSAKAYYDDIKRRAVVSGRAADDVKVLPGCCVVTGRTRAEAEDKYERLQQLIPEDLGLRMLSGAIGVDLMKYDIDGPLPDFDIERNVGHRKVIADFAKRGNRTIREVYQHLGGMRSHRVVIGTPTEVADDLENWFKSGACDGFNIMPVTFPEGLDDFVDLVTPELQRRGLFRTSYESSTLRGNLGLAIPERGA